MNTEQMKALERNIRLRNGRREIPREIPRPHTADALETLGHLTIYSVIAATIAVGLWFSLSIAERQYAIADRINQENGNVR